MTQVSETVVRKDRDLGLVSLILGVLTLKTGGLNCMSTESKRRKVNGRLLLYVEDKSVDKM